MTTTDDVLPEWAAAQEATDLDTPKSAAGLTLTKFLDPLRIPPTIKAWAKPAPRRLRVRMYDTEVKLHSQLPPTRVWTYEGSFPGPTIEVRRGHKLRVTWKNDISGDFPVTAVDLANATPGPGRDGADPSKDVAALPPWTVVHLHGARTSGGNDGWTENAVLPGEAQLAEYLNDQQATTMWYHDHAMAITRLNMASGLMGMYLIRDDEEDALCLPSGKHEIPLIVCDRNLDTDIDGNLTGELLYKRKLFQTTPEIPLPFLGPFTLVNGVIWPHLKVDARWVRFRVLNASSARFYRFELRDENGAPITGAMYQIGTDGGLLPKPVPLKDLTLAPAERADILIDFRALRGTSVRLVNTLQPPLEPGTNTPNIDVMQFRVRDAKVNDPFKLPDVLSPSFVRLDHDVIPDDHKHRWIVLVLVKDRHPEAWEMREIKNAPPNTVDGIVQVKVKQKDGTEKTITLQRVGRDFHDAATFYVKYKGWEIWKILNLTHIPPVPHPMHIHLVQFQALGRQFYDVTSFDREKEGTTAPVTPKEPDPLNPNGLDANEEGWKDVIRVGAGELVTVAAEFDGGTGRFMYHCHILDHEDEGMMSTFVVTPAEVMAVDPHMGGHGHDH